jgi:hypothetical protein
MKQIFLTIMLLAIVCLSVQTSIATIPPKTSDPIDATFKCGIKWPDLQMHWENVSDAIGINLATDNGMLDNWMGKWYYFDSHAAANFHIIGANGADVLATFNAIQDIVNNPDDDYSVDPWCEDGDTGYVEGVSNIKTTVPLKLKNLSTDPVINSTFGQSIVSGGIYRVKFNTMPKPGFKYIVLTCTVNYVL